jgi:hypothetical protein
MRLHPRQLGREAGPACVCRKVVQCCRSWFLVRVMYVILHEVYLPANCKKVLDKGVALNGGYTGIKPLTRVKMDLWSDYLVLTVG